MSDNAAVETQVSDPLKTVADAMEHAVRAARDGASDAKAKVDQALPAVKNMASDLVIGIGVCLRCVESKQFQKIAYLTSMGDSVRSVERPSLVG